MRTARSALLALTAGATLAGARGAFADESPAETLFREGRSASRAGDWTTACAKFAESHRLDPAPGTTLNLARCEETAGRPTRALEMYRDLAGRLAPGDERSALVAERARELQSRVGRLTIRAANPGVPLTVERDGVPVDAGSVEPVLVDPGRHLIVTKARGYEDRLYAITIGEGESSALLVEAGSPIERPAAPVPVAPAPRDERGSVMRSTGFVVGGLGIAGLVVGTITGLVVLHKKSVVSEHCKGYDCDEVGYEAAHGGNALATASTVAFVAGATALASGVVLVVSAPDPSRPGVHAALRGRFR